MGQSLRKDAQLEAGLSPNKEYSLAEPNSGLKFRWVIEGFAQSKAAAEGSSAVEV